MYEAARLRTLKYINTEPVGNNYSVFQIFSALIGKELHHGQPCNSPIYGKCGICYHCKSQNAIGCLTALCSRPACILRFNSWLPWRQEEYLRQKFPDALYLSLWDLRNLRIIPSDLWVKDTEAPMSISLRRKIAKQRTPLVDQL